MTARVKPAAEGDAEIVKMPTAEAPKTAPGPAPAPQAAAPAEVAKPRKRGGKRIALMVAVPLVLVAGGSYVWLTGGRYEDTDNAYVQQPKVSLSADVSGRIVEVDVKANQAVKAGQVLFRIDPEPYRIALSQADAALAGARQSVEQLRVAYSTAETKLAADQSALDIRQREQARNENLVGKGVATRASTDEVALALQQAEAAVEADKQAVQGALAALGGNADIKTDDVPAVRQALAAEDLA
jgi:membrane fusion protein (multidrug efflux system)